MISNLLPLSFTCWEGIHISQQRKTESSCISTKRPVLPPETQNQTTTQPSLLRLHKCQDLDHHLHYACTSALLRHNLHTINDTHFKCTGYVLTNVYTQITMISMKIETISVTTFLPASLNSGSPVALASGNHWSAFCHSRFIIFIISCNVIRQYVLVSGFFY